MSPIEKFCNEFKTEATNKNLPTRVVNSLTNRIYKTYVNMPESKWKAAAEILLQQALGTATSIVIQKAKEKIKEAVKPRKKKKGGKND